MHLVGQHSNPSDRLRMLIDGFSERPIVKRGRPFRPSTSVPVRRRLGNGVVKKAVLEVLATNARSMRAIEVHAGVEALLGHPVSKHSVNWCLTTGVRRNEPRFVRTA